MDAQTLYDELKDALRFFGLRFSEMHLVRVTWKGGVLHFHHGGRTISVPAGEE